MVKPVSPPICPYCGGDAVLVAGSVIYGDRRDQDLADKKFWYCAGDAAWIGAQAKTERPLGTMADADLRAAREAAHQHFDWLVRAAARRDNIGYFRAQGHAYKWLREQMQLPASERCDIEFFDAAKCARVVEIFAPFTTKLRR